MSQQGYFDNNEGNPDNLPQPSNQELLNLQLQRAIEHVAAQTEKLMQDNQVLHDRMTAGIPISANTAVPRPRGTFKMPSIKPHKFEGKPRNKPAHELQTFLNGYLTRSKDLCILHGFAPDRQSVELINQPTYVQFTSTGLEGTARILWEQVPEIERHNMTWPEYCTWINAKCGSQLSLPQAVATMDTLKQTRSATEYSSAFNELVSTLVSSEIDLPAKYLCIKYLNGLKLHLQTIPELFRINNNLSQLQGEAERLDDIIFRKRRWNEPARPTQFDTNARNQPRLSQVVPEPMELDNLQPSFKLLTPQEKEFFRSQGWCTYCQEKSHPTNKCPKLKNRKGPPAKSFNFKPRKEGIHFAAQVDTGQPTVATSATRA
jgi:hypothetical protein